MKDDHGGNRNRLAQAAGHALRDLLDFSVNINPVGLSPRAEAALRTAIGDVIHYPDPLARELVEALAAYHKMPPASLLAGNGATDMIYLVARAVQPRRSLVVHPAFSEYEAALEPLGSEIVRVIGQANAGFTPPRDELLREAARVDLVFIAHPGNPTGALTPSELLLELIEVCDGAGTSLAVDEAFIDFTEDASVKRETLCRPRLAVVRSLTKFFALAGLRAGYAFLGQTLREQAERWRQPWAVNRLAEVAAVAALADTDYQLETRRQVPVWRRDLARSLGALPGLTVFSSSANYVLVALPDGRRADALQRFLLARALAVRDCASFPGLGPQFIRVAVRPPSEQKALLDALTGWLTGRA